MRILLSLVAAAFLLLISSVAAHADVQQLLHDDMTLPHEYHPNGVPHNYQWYNGPFQSPPAPIDYRSVTAWGQVYRCEGAGLDPDDTIEVSSVQTWELDAAGWHEYQTGPLSGAAYPEDFQGSPVAANVVGISDTTSWVKVRMSPEGYNFHFYPRVRAPYDPFLVFAVVVAAHVRLLAYGGSTQCVVAGMGADYWNTTSGSQVKGATLGRLKHAEGWRLFTATIGNPTTAPPIVASPSEIR